MSRGFLTFFKKNFCWRCGSNAHHPIADSTKDTNHRWENLIRTGGVAYLGILRYQSTPSVFYTLIITYLKGFVKGSLRIIETFFRVGYIPSYGGIASALDIIIIAYSELFVKSFFWKFSNIFENFHNIFYSVGFSCPAVAVLFFIIEKNVKRIFTKHLFRNTIGNDRNSIPF